MSPQGPNTQGAAQDPPQGVGSKRPDPSAKPKILMAEVGHILRGPVGEVLRQHFDVREVADAETAW